MTDAPYDYIAEAITGQWGERCPDYEPQCACCAAWAQYDALTNAKRTRKVPIPDRAQIIADYRAGTPVADVLAKYALPAASLYRILDAAGIKLRGNHTRSAADCRRAARMYRDGEKLDYIAASLRMSPNTVIKWAKRAGVFGRAKHRA